MNRRLASVAALALLASLTACGLDDPADKKPAPVPSATTPTVGPEEATGSMFTDNGTFMSHTTIDGIDFVLTMYPTDATPYTHEWYPKGDKFFTMSMTAYDTDRDERDPYATKRMVFFERLTITSVAVDADGETVGLEPYRLDEQPARITFDPEPLADPQYGMVITSPKGAFELRDQVIGDLDPSVRMVTLQFRADVWAQNTAGSAELNRHTIDVEIPIVIFDSDKETTNVNEDAPEERD
ncbi:MAG: hypothetical protein QM621_13890 [Aeromicrobium sp.]|uniref:hypothetical protein n=1 Tax=Aeromicrobium sp. TaxID=1871063 RepID=UPI0039E6400B